jgi:GTP-binding protein EngB required for normal cell division
VRRFDAYLAQGQAADLRARVSRLAPDAEAGLLGHLERIVDRQGLVEFRPALAMILDRLEDQRFEIAVFGRVSTGKSSLLNRLLETAVLPVGVNPITSIPTRVVHGPSPLVRVWVAARAPETVSIDRLPDFVTESGNPGNTRRVTRVVVELPARVLEQGVVFVDTPGLGSLATSGAAETFAYLPRCDLGIVLIDATSSLSPEDVGTVRTLAEAGIPAVVLISKADLITEADRGRVVEYVTGRLRDQLQLDVHVRPVSVRPDHLALLEQWAAEEIGPLIQRHRELARESIGRKIAGLRDRVAAALRVRADHAAQPALDTPPSEGAAIEGELRRTATTFAETRATCHDIVSQLSGLSGRAIERAADDLLEVRQAGRVPPEAATAALARGLDDLVGPLVADIRARLQDLARTAREASARLESAPGSDAASDSARELDIAEAPRPDIGALQIDLRAPTRAFGRRLARAMLLRALARASADAVFHTLSSYGTVLRSWTSATIDRLQEEFDARTIVLRAFIMTTVDRRTSDDRDALVADLDALESVGHGPVDSAHGA